MIDTAYEIYSLLIKHLREELSDEEKTQLNNWINQSTKNRALFLEISNPESLKEAVLDYYKVTEEPETEESGGDDTGSVVNMHVGGAHRTRYYMGAAAVLLLVLAGLWLWLRPGNKNAGKEKVEYGLVADVEPGKDGAVLTLADGRQIVLDTAANGVLTLQGKSEVRKKDGQLSYASSKAVGASAALTVQYNTLVTPRARQFQLMLPDGTKIWLNAASSVKFPTQFIGSDRRIEVTGEAYLEVAKDASKPFIVAGENMKIEVLGTKFNFNGYKDDGSIKTTLIEGKVKVISGSETAMLAPGQQATVIDDKLNVVSNANIDEAIAWKNGLITFSRADIKQAMNQISRWYNVDVDYKTAVSVPLITGKIPRTLKLSEALELLELYTGLNFIIGSNKITIEQRK